MKNTQFLYQVYGQFAFGLALAFLAERLARNLLGGMTLDPWVAGGFAALLFGVLVLVRQRKGLNAAILGLFAMALGVFRAATAATANVELVPVAIAIVTMLILTVLVHARSIRPERLRVFLRAVGGMLVVVLIASQFMPDMWTIPVGLLLIAYMAGIHMRETGRVLFEYRAQELAMPTAYMLVVFLLWVGFF